jgi:hypothetical protein
MSPRRDQRPACDEVGTAIGLVWGHLNALQYEQAYQLGKVCMALWPEEERLALLVAYAQVELFDKPDAATAAVLQRAQCPDWAALVARRSGAFTTRRPAIQTQT